MNSPEVQCDLIVDALEAAKKDEDSRITAVREMPTAPRESPMIAVTATGRDGLPHETTITLESDGSGIYYVHGPETELRREIQRIAEAAIA